MNAQQQNEELRQRTEQALLRARPFLDRDDYALLCWHAGITPTFIESPIQKELSNAQH